MNDTVSAIKIADTIKGTSKSEEIISISERLYQMKFVFPV